MINQHNLNAATVASNRRDRRGPLQGILPVLASRSLRSLPPMSP